MNQSLRSAIRLVRTASFMAFMLGTGSALHAQSLVSASVSVPTASPTGGGVRNLAFGSVTPVPAVTQVVSIPAAVGPQSASTSSGEFAMGVAGASGVDFTISVPTVLTSSVGGLTLPISFNGLQYGAACVMQGASGCALTQFNPAAGGILKQCREYKGNGDCKTNGVWPSGTTLRVFVGGTVSVAPNAVAATYTGVITLSIVQVY